MHEEAAQSIEDAWTRTTPTRERISMNGLWQFRPVLSEAAAADGKDTSKKAEDIIPANDDCWGWFKLPAIWPDRRPPRIHRPLDGLLFSSDTKTTWLLLRPAFRTIFY